MAEPPYGVIWDCIKEGTIIPFLGAGASIVGRGSDATWDPKNPQFLPSGSELSRHLAKKTSFPAQEERERSDLSKVASYYAAINGRDKLRDNLEKVLSPAFGFGPIHEFLASKEIEKPLLIVTTNYDTLLEDAFKKAGKKYHLIVHPTDQNDNANVVWWWPDGADKPSRVATTDGLDPAILEETTVIYKMHGTINRDVPDMNSFVITEEDYVDFLSKLNSDPSAIPSIIYNHFRTRSFLFLGYGLGDWNLRVILKNLDSFLNKQRLDAKDESVKSWAIQRNPSELECELWGKRDVKIYDMPLDDFVERMKEEH